MVIFDYVCIDSTIHCPLYDDFELEYDKFLKTNLIDHQLALYVDDRLSYDDEFIKKNTEFVPLFNVVFEFVPIFFISTTCPSYSAYCRSTISIYDVELPIR